MHKFAVRRGKTHDKLCHVSVLKRTKKYSKNFDIWFIGSVEEGEKYFDVHGGENAW
jgi:hypothetical protein